MPAQFQILTQIVAPFVLLSISSLANGGQTFRLNFESEADLLSDFISQFDQYKPMGRDGLVKRNLHIGEGRFGKGLEVRDGWPISKGTWNESGLDCDLIVATMWGEWHTKPHYWGSGAFHGDRGTVAFWVRSATLHPGVVFMQGHIGWGRHERDLFSIEVDKEGRLSAFIRDVAYDYHRISAREPTWIDRDWQHIAASWDRSYGLNLFHNGEEIGSTWGEDAWWLTGQPGLFSPFLPEASYDEIAFFDRPLEPGEIRSLYENNTAPSSPPAKTHLDEEARVRLLASFGDLGRQELPSFVAGVETLNLKQVLPKDCHDELVSAWWVMDGRYELAWPHPYRMFTFILGDVDFKGTKIDLDLPPGAAPNFAFFEGILENFRLESVASDGATKTLTQIDSSQGLFTSRRIDTGGGVRLTIPLVQGYGSPPDLEGSARLPLTGETRIQEMSLWEASAESSDSEVKRPCIEWRLSQEAEGTALPRYGAALRKLLGSRDRQTLLGDLHRSIPSEAPVHPLESVHLFSPGLGPDRAIESIGLRLYLQPNAHEEVLWLKVRDPSNPSRVWSQVCTRIEFPESLEPQSAAIDLDIPDLLLASEDRLWVELIFKEGGTLLLGDETNPSRLIAYLSEDRETAAAEYTKYELLPAQLQFSKEYNYRPWRLTGEKVHLGEWSQFGGPYDMAYPPLAVLRHNPHSEMAYIYKTMIIDRDRRAWVPKEAIKRPLEIDAPEGTPEWAIWERELVRINQRVCHWIVSRQRQDGQFWGGWNDDPFIPLGFPSLPLLGDKIVNDSWLRFYDGLEEAGIFADGYCDIWPIDPLHITDFISSRGLTLAFALGDPQVFERELRTTERYKERVDATNARLAAEGKPPLSAERSGRDRADVTLVEQMDAEILNYSQTFVRWYWGMTAEPEPYVLVDRNELARRMQDAVLSCDRITEFDFTESMIHTDGQGVGIGREELVAAALGGRLQGRIEPYPHGIAASWESDPGEDLARLVTYAGTDSLRVNLYNFTDKSVETTLRVWRLEPGKFEVEQGPDSDDDGEIDSDQRVQLGNRELRRFSTLDISIPPQVNYGLSIELTGGGERPDPLPDLAISPKDLIVTEKGVELIVHNIGAAPAESVQVLVKHRQQRDLTPDLLYAIDTPLESPSDSFSAQVHPITLMDRFPNDSPRIESVPKNWIEEIRIDPENQIDEILEDNNVVRFEEP